MGTDTRATGDLYTGLRSLDLFWLAMNSKNQAFILHFMCWGWWRKTPPFTRASKEEGVPPGQEQEPWGKEAASRLAQFPEELMKGKLLC